MATATSRGGQDTSTGRHEKLGYRDSRRASGDFFAQPSQSSTGIDLGFVGGCRIADRVPDAAERDTETFVKQRSER